ncbi:DDT domain-containing protein [Forsythia ovata]|uniref:DDT domain-containing protein n=1 Tax=Forsythia ovata TaxID=205694 RepID=A0ABD1WK35_9LAMI
MVSNNDMSTLEQPIDSLVPMSKIGGKGKDANMRKNAKELKGQEYLHPTQSIFLGSDRRYNRYWIFLGPCDEFDPGHKRIYFESSEDGNWEVIDSQELQFLKSGRKENRKAIGAVPKLLACGYGSHFIQNLTLLKMGRGHILTHSEDVNTVMTSIGEMRSTIERPSAETMVLKLSSVNTISEASLAT